MAPSDSLELMQGTVDILVLRTLAWAPMHGYAISRWIRERTAGALALENAALYPALHRLERRKLVTATWGTSETGRRAKFYELTPLGRKQLRTATATWRSYVDAVLKVLSPAEG
ncbi:MAG TPA: PadR family transcriptional regulator [Gemmatimonadaceae bacterium]